MTLRDTHISADGVNRADARLRTFCRREGDAVFCSRCDGDGYTVAAEYGRNPAQIMKCGRCNGEGLEP